MEVTVSRIRNFLCQLQRKTVLLDKLQQVCCKVEYEEFRRAVRQLELEEVLSPIRTAGQDFGGLSRKYRVSAGRLFAADAERMQQDVQHYGLSSRLDFSWYYRQPLKVWQRELAAIRKLSGCLQKTAIWPVASQQQRSYEIFGDEKFLLGPGRLLLAHLGISEESLGIGGQPDPLMMAVCPAVLTDTVCHHLVVENKAPYYGLLPFLPDSGFASLIFGAGWKIVGNLRTLPEQCGAVTSQHVVWYFGDFDWEGLSIWQALLAIEGVSVQLAVPFYQALLQHPSTQGKEKQQPNPAALEAFCACFEAVDIPRWQEILQQQHYYPQETLTQEELQRGWEEIRDAAGKFS